MGMLDRLLNRERLHWHVCYACLMQTNHDALNSIFYDPGPPAEVNGRLVKPCPRCESTNTISFQKLRDEGSDAQLWGLEQLVKIHPRSRFEIKRPSSVKSTH
jgi:hypothetical protein